MKSYTSRPFVIKKDIKSVYELFRTPLSAEHFLKKMDDKLPISDVVLTEDTIEFNTSVIGKIAMERSEAVEPHLIRYTGTQTPVPVVISMSLTEETPESTNTQITVEANVPSFLSGMVKSKVEPALEKVADALEELDVDRFLGKKES